MTYFATKQKIDESRFLQIGPWYSWSKFYCKGPEHFVRFLDLSDEEAISPATDDTEGPIFDVQEHLRKEVGKGYEVHIYETSIPENKFDSSRAWDYIIDDRAELLVY